MKIGAVMTAGFVTSSYNADTQRNWNDPKRYLWLLAAAIPCLVMVSWLAVKVTGFGGFWWLGALLTFVVMPLLDCVVGTDRSTPADDAYIDLDNDHWYRWATYLYLPTQYLSLIFACWLLERWRLDCPVADRPRRPTGHGGDRGRYRDQRRPRVGTQKRPP